MNIRLPDRIGIILNFPKEFPPDKYPKDLSKSLHKVIETLNNQKSQIKAIQVWFTKCLSFAKEMAQQIADYIISHTNKILIKIRIIYLINSIFFKSLNGHCVYDQLCISFTPHLGVILRAMYVSSSLSLQYQLNKLLNYWHDMGVFSIKTVYNIKKVMISSPWATKKCHFKGKIRNLESVSSCSKNKECQNRRYVGVKSSKSIILTKNENILTHIKFENQFQSSFNSNNKTDLKNNSEKYKILAEYIHAKMKCFYSETMIRMIRDEIKPKSSKLSPNNFNIANQSKQYQRNSENRKISHAGLGIHRFQKTSTKSINHSNYKKGSQALFNAYKTFKRDVFKI